VPPFLSDDGRQHSFLHLEQEGKQAGEFTRLPALISPLSLSLSLSLCEMPWNKLCQVTIHKLDVRNLIFRRAITFVSVLTCPERFWDSSSLLCYPFHGGSFVDKYLFRWSFSRKNISTYERGSNRRMEKII